jgi:hypothetical protein
MSMRIFVVDRVKLDPQTGLVAKVRWGEADSGSNRWVRGPILSDVDNVLRRILEGEDVYTFFSVDGKVKIGPRLCVIRDAVGRESIETQDANNPSELKVAQLSRL